MRQAWAQSSDIRTPSCVSAITNARMSPVTKWYWYQSINAPHSIGIEVSKYWSIDFGWMLRWLMLFLDTGANSLSPIRLKLLIFDIFCSFSLYKQELRRKYRLFGMEHNSGVVGYRRNDSIESQLLSQHVRKKRTKRARDSLSRKSVLKFVMLLRETPYGGKLWLR